MLLPPPHNFILFQLDFDVNFPLLRLLLYLIDLKSNITRQQIDAKIQCFHVIDLKKLFHTYIDLLLYRQNSILLCRLLQHRFYKSYYNVSFICGKLLFTRRQRLSNRNCRRGKQ